MTAMPRPLGFPRWVVPAAIAALVALLVTPGLIVLASDDDGDAAVQSVRLGGLTTDVAVVGDTVWVVSGRDNSVVAIDAAQPAARRRGDTGAAPLRIAAGEHSVWTADAGSNTVTRVNPLLPGATGHRINVGADAVDVAVDYDGTWVTNGQRGTVTRIDPVSNQLLGPPIRTGNFPTALTVGANLIWVVNSGDGTVARIDPREDVVIGRRTPSDATRRTSRSGSARCGSPTAATAPSPVCPPPTAQPAGCPDPRRALARRARRHPPTPSSCSTPCSGDVAIARPADRAQPRHRARLRLPDLARRRSRCRLGG